MSSCDYPQSCGMPEGGAFLGYDYGYALNPYSVLYDEILGDDIAGLGRFKASLNENGLFHSQDSFDDYLACRKELLSKGHDLEDSDHLFAFKLTELNIELVR